MEFLQPIKDSKHPALRSKRCCTFWRAMQVDTDATPGAGPWPAGRQARRAAQWRTVGPAPGPQRGGPSGKNILEFPPKIFKKNPLNSILIIFF